jgi:hypothetical protein
VQVKPSAPAVLIPSGAQNLGQRLHSLGAAWNDFTGDETNVAPLADRQLEVFQGSEVKTSTASRRDAAELGIVKVHNATSDIGRSFLLLAMSGAGEV